MTEPVELAKVRRLAALERIFAFLDARWNDRYAVDADLLALMDAVDDGDRRIGKRPT